MSLENGHELNLSHEVSAEQIVNLFNALFHESYATALLGGAEEPFYEVFPDRTARVVFREDYVASALHEVAHWCLAGEQRRQRNDYGYWYIGQRDEIAQANFERVEARPQALEWIFSRALGVRFRVSADNLDLKGHDLMPFRIQVQAEVKRMLVKGLGARARQFALSLSKIGQTSADAFCLEQYRELPN